MQITCVMQQKKDKDMFKTYEYHIEDMEESRENLEGLVQRLTIQNDALVAALEAAYDQLPCVCGDNFETCDCAVAKVTAALSEQVK